jgi:hypothetical protein
VSRQRRARERAAPQELHNRPYGPKPPPSATEWGYIPPLTKSEPEVVLAVRNSKGDPFEPSRFEPHVLPLRVTNPKYRLYKSRKWNPPSKTGIPFYGPPTIALARLQRNLAIAVIQVKRLCHSTRTNHEFNLLRKSFHELIRLLKASGLAHCSSNVKHWMGVLGVSLRIAEKEHRSRASVLKTEPRYGAASVLHTEATPSTLRSR